MTDEPRGSVTAWCSATRYALFIGGITERPPYERCTAAEIWSKVRVDKRGREIAVSHPLLQRAHRHADRRHPRPERVPQ